MTPNAEPSPLFEWAKFEQTFNAHLRRLESILHHRLRGTTLQGSIDLIVDNSRIRAWKKWPVYLRMVPQIDPFVWLYGIVSDCRIEEFRKPQHNGRHPRMLPLSAGTSFQIGANLSAGTGTPSFKVMRDEMIDIVRRAIELLPDRDRAIIEMHDDDGLTFREIAEQIGEEHDAVNKRYTRALNKKLKALLEKMLGDYRP